MTTTQSSSTFNCRSCNRFLKIFSTVKTLPCKWSTGETCPTYPEDRSARVTAKHCICWIPTSDEHPYTETLRISDKIEEATLNTGLRDEEMLQAWEAYSGKSHGSGINPLFVFAFIHGWNALMKVTQQPLIDGCEKQDEEQPSLKCPGGEK